MLSSTPTYRWIKPLIVVLISLLSLLSRRGLLTGGVKRKTSPTDQTGEEPYHHYPKHNKMTTPQNAFITVLSVCLMSFHASAQPWFRCNHVVPSSPRRLSLYSVDGGIRAFWGPPNNRPCDVRYYVETFILEKNKYAKSPKSVSSLAVDTMGAEISGLEPGKEYLVVVTPFTTTMGAGAAVYATISIPVDRDGSIGQNGFPNIPGNQEGVIKGPEKGNDEHSYPLDGHPGWICRNKESTYPFCPAAVSRLCAPVSCKRIAKLGLCSAPWIRVTDWDQQIVTQHCSDECGTCSGAPTLRSDMEPLHGDYCCGFGTGEYFQFENGTITNGL